MTLPHTSSQLGRGHPHTPPHSIWRSQLNAFGTSNWGTFPPIFPQTILSNIKYCEDMSRSRWLFWRKTESDENIMWLDRKSFNNNNKNQNIYKPRKNTGRSMVRTNRLFFHWLLISRISYVENSLHFNLADFFPVDLINEFGSLWWWAIPKICVYLISRFYSKWLGHVHFGGFQCRKMVTFTLRKADVHLCIKNLRSNITSWPSSKQCGYVDPLEPCFRGLWKQEIYTHAVKLEFISCIKYDIINCLLVDSQLRST